jgi:hypothetical protein
MLFPYANWSPRLSARNCSRCMCERALNHVGFTHLLYLLAPSWTMKGYLMLLGLIANLGLVLSVPTAGQLPFTFSKSTIDNDFPMVSEDTSKYFDHLRRRYGIKGLSIAVVASPTYTGEGWLNQTIPLGEADVNGNKVTDQVGSPSTMKLTTDTLCYCVQFEAVYIGRYPDTGC